MQWLTFGFEPTKRESVESFDRIRRPIKCPKKKFFIGGRQWNPPMLDGFHYRIDFIVTVEVAKHAPETSFTFISDFNH